ncbi:MAG: 4-hydroxy-tetrahydrodipicolinate reductase [Desulfobacterota bacterium]|nr:4-hydroxy-tetrahydrodipicolinate reductase [Thermodesulfobacteriota bacterium]
MNTDLVSCVVVGALGRMGQRICHLLATVPGFSLKGAVECPGNPCIGKSLTETLGVRDVAGCIVDDLAAITERFDVVIDFTFPEVSLKTATFCNRSGTAAVIGTTGFTVEQFQQLQELSAAFPCVCAPNMSVGVTVLFKLVNDVAQALRTGFDVEVVEMHHRHKKDAPSGTALRIAQILAQAYGWDLAQAGVYQRRGITGARRDAEIGIQSLRGGDVVGEHTVLFAGTGERLELVHRAYSRDCFAQGALTAARWVGAQPAGMYDMQDVLGLR